MQLLIEVSTQISSVFLHHSCASNREVIEGTRREGHLGGGWWRVSVVLGDINASWIYGREK